MIRIVDEWRGRIHPRIWLDTGTGEGDYPERVVEDARLLGDALLRRKWSEESVIANSIWQATMNAPGRIASLRYFSGCFRLLQNRLEWGRNLRQNNRKYGATSAAGLQFD